VFNYESRLCYKQNLMTSGMGKKNLMNISEVKLSPINIGILEEFNFGSLDGERDDNLKDCFVITKEINNLLKYKFNYVLSPKGAGKSSVFKALIEKYSILKNNIDLNKYHFIQVNRAFDNNDSYLEKTKFKSNLSHNKYTVSWSFYLAIKLIEDILINHKDKSNYEDFESKIKKYDNLKDTYELYNILDYIENFNVVLKFTAGGIDYSIKPIFGNKKKTKPLKLNELYSIINEFYKKNGIIARVLIDRIDNFVEKEEYDIQKNYLQGLIYAVEEISLLANIQPLIFLRTDLFYSHSINIEYDKIRDRMIELKWTKAEILTFILLRLLSIESINKAHYEYFRHCVDDNYHRTKGLNKHASKLYIFLKKVLKKQKKIDLAKNINYEISYQFIKLYFPKELIHVNENWKEENIDLDDWIFSHFVDGNSFVNPRTLLRFLNLLAKKQLDYYNEHNIVPSRILNAGLVDGDTTYRLFSPIVMKDVYERLQNEELRNIYKLLYSKEAQCIFLRINQLSISHTKINYGDINLKVYNCEKEECDRILKYLSLLGYLTPIDNKTYKVPPIYRKAVNLN
jgi:hypothetical protein